MLASKPSINIEIYLINTKLFKQNVNYEQLQQRNLGILSIDEIAYLESIKSNNRKEQFILSRCALRYALSQHANLLPRKWQFTYNKHNKPQLEQSLFSSYPILFNVSHSNHLLLVGILTGDNVFYDEMFGVDAEYIKDRKNIYKIITNIASNAEQKLIHKVFAGKINLKHESILAWAYRFWARKEAAVKAKGTGVFELNKMQINELMQVNAGVSHSLSYCDEIIDTNTYILKFNSFSGYFNDDLTIVDAKKNKKCYALAVCFSQAIYDSYKVNISVSNFTQQLLLLSNTDN